MSVLYAQQPLYSIITQLIMIQGMTRKSRWIGHFFKRVHNWCFGILMKTLTHKLRWQQIFNWFEVIYTSRFHPRSTGVMRMSIHGCLFCCYSWSRCVSNYKSLYHNLTVTHQWSYSIIWIQKYFTRLAKLYSSFKYLRYIGPCSSVICANVSILFPPLWLYSVKQDDLSWHNSVHGKHWMYNKY